MKGEGHRAKKKEERDPWILCCVNYQKKRPGGSFVLIIQKGGAERGKGQGSFGTQGKTGGKHESVKSRKRVRGKERKTHWAFVTPAVKARSPSVAPGGGQSGVA